VSAPQDAAPREILVRGPNWLGDLVMCTPAFRALRTCFPGARISLHVRAALVPLLEGAPWFDAVLPVASYGRGALAMLREGRALRARSRFELGVCLPDSWSSALLMRAAGVRRVIGYARAGRGVLLDVALPVPASAARRGRTWVARERHALGVVTAAATAAAVGPGPDPDTRLELFTTADDEARADAALRAQGLAASAPFAALAPGASYGGAKRWPAASFARVGDEARTRGLEVVVLGGSDEAGVVHEVVGAMRGRGVSLVGLDLGALKSVVRRARVMVCNDAGARHVAVAFGVPCVVMFGPTSLAKTDCNLARVRVLETDVACRPCYERECPIDHRCMTRIEPERVTAAMVAWLDADPGTRDPRVPGSADALSRSSR
jgi:heptosyltransferase-2